MSNDANIATGLSMLAIAEALRPLLAEGLANDLAGFVKKAWCVLQPGRPLLWSWHYDYLCEVLVLVKLGVLKRVIINVPPRTLKSMLVTIIYPVWIWLTDPWHQFLMASYSFGLSSEHSIRRRNLLNSDWVQGLWGEWLQLSGGRNQVGQFINNHGGQMIATSVGGTVMGRGCDTAILDDPLSADQAQSAVERTKTNGWIDSTLRNRLNDPARGAIILVAQRLHESDPTGFFLEQGHDVWYHVRIPLEAEEDETWVFPISGRVVQRRAGEILMPERFTQDVVKEKKSCRLSFACQYQQRPVPVEGNLITLDNIRYYGGVDPRTGRADEKLPNFDFKFISVDCAFKDSPTSSFVAIGVIGVKGPLRFVLNVVNKHLNAAATEAEIRRQRNLYGSISAVLVEDKANGPAVIERLRMNIPGVVSITPQGGKVPRMQAVLSEWQAGNWYVERNAAWTGPFIDQLTMFPASRHDDMVDMMSQAASWLVRYQLPTVESHNAFTGEVNWSINSGLWRADG
jgi:predicted phage terminase large subunit-like protein